jgi:hypothetical protein
MVVALHVDPGPGEHLIELPGRYCRPSPMGTYWHMPRSASIYTPRHGWAERLIVRFWCGQHRYAEWAGGLGGQLLCQDTDPDGDVCGTCWGRSAGYHDPVSGLRFAPRDHFGEPSWCPMSAWPADRTRNCPLCGAHVTHARGWTATGIARHRPAGLVTTDPCPRHGWTRIVTVGAGMYCTDLDCGYEALWGQRWEVGSD